MKRIIYLILLEISKGTSKFALYLNLPILTAFAFLISLRSIKSSFKNNNKKKILIFEKSHGIDDIKQITILKKDDNLNFYLLSRIHLWIIYDYFKTKDLRNNDKYFFDKKDEEKYLNYINKVFYFFKKIINIELIISFNARYPGEIICQNLDKNLKIKYIVLQKECLFTESALLNLKNFFLKRKKFNGDHLTTYNEQYKDMLLSTNFINKDKITVIGMNRADKYFSSKNKNQNHILYLLIRPNSGLIENDTSFSWHALAETSLKITLDNAEKNQNMNFIFKAKILNDKETFSQQELIKKKSLKNCSIVSGGDSYSLIKDAKLIIAFNSTAIFESLACKKKILIPYFQNYSEYLNNYIVNTLNSPNIFHAKTEIEMIDYLDKISSEKNELIYEESTNDKKLLDFYLGNSDGNSTSRLVKVIENQIL